MKSFNARLDNEHLISLVEGHPNLYNPFLKNYRNKNVRYHTWQKISSILGVDSVACQKRWRNLRDRYKKEKSGTHPNKNNKPWELAPLMTFLDEMYQEHSNSLPWKTSQPIQSLTSQPVVITVPKKKTPRPIAPKRTEPASESNNPPKLIAVNVNQDSSTENVSEEHVQPEPELYLVTPTLFNDQERTLFNKSLSAPKRKASFENEEKEAMLESTKAKRAAIEEDSMLRRQEFDYKMQWEEKEHFLRVKCQEEEHEVKMQIEQAKLKVEEQNLKIKEQKLKVLLAKEAYFKSLIKTEVEE